jgi:hypothetical protein
MATRRNAPRRPSTSRRATRRPSRHSRILSMSRSRIGFGRLLEGLRRKPGMPPKLKTEPAGCSFSWPPRFYFLGRGIPHRGCCKMRRTSQLEEGLPGTDWAPSVSIRTGECGAFSGPVWRFPFLCHAGGMCYKRASEGRMGWNSRKPPEGSFRRPSQNSLDHAKHRRTLIRRQRIAWNTLRRTARGARQGWNREAAR